MYKDIKSRYIRDKIKQTKWKNRQYIHSLKCIELLAPGKTFGLTTGYAWMNLPRMYPDEWEAIWTEINPEGYNEWRSQKKREVKAEQRAIRKEKEREKIEINKEKAEWLEMGGKE